MPKIGNFGQLHTVWWQRFLYSSQKHAQKGGKMLKIWNAILLALMETNKKYVKRSTIRNIVRKGMHNLGTGNVTTQRCHFWKTCLYHKERCCLRKHTQCVYSFYVTFKSRWGYNNKEKSMERRSVLGQHVKSRQWLAVLGVTGLRWQADWVWRLLFREDECCLEREKGKEMETTESL